MRVRISLLAPVLVGFFGLALGAEAKDLANTVYGKDDPPAQVLSGVLLVGGPPTPVLISINSGGWRSSPGRRGPGGIQAAQAMINAGFAAVTVNHRTVEKYAWPAQIDDILRAVQYVRLHAREWNIDPKRIAITGRSSGGHLAMMVGFLPDRAKADSLDPVERESSRVRCVLAGSGPADLEMMARNLDKFASSRQEPSFIRSTLLLLLGVKEDQWGTDEFFRRLGELSPLNHIDPSDPPIFLQYEGPEDATDPADPRLVWHAHTPISGVILAKKLNENQVPFELFMKPDLRNRAREIEQHRLEFLKKYN